ncbi:MAG: glycosyltransferase family 2 protein [Acidobacteria bacterium]|nr:glycosyltransferase family 2 protein [Acidobacteriota bacterium]
MSAGVAVSIVTYNSAQHLHACLQSLKTQSYGDFDIYIFDNASSDATAGIIEESRPMLQSVHYSAENLGFCAAHNRILGSSSSKYVLVLNPDVVLDSRFLEILTREMDRDPAAGSATGKLYRRRRTSPGTEAPPRVSGRMELDSTGIFFTRCQRHFDRGSGEIDAGQYNRREYVFGASGAAAFYRRGMLEDIRSGKEFFDESFFAYREDADLAWRARWMGWECLYVPGAIAFHERRVLPERRSSLPPAINMHSFKNRFLLRIKNMDAGTYARNFIPITFRDAAACGYVLLREWSSIPALPRLVRALSKALAQRRALEKKRRTPPQEMRRWLSGLKSKPAPET